MRLNCMLTPPAPHQEKTAIADSEKAVLLT